MAWEWRCLDCGQGWPEEGHGRYTLVAIQHMKRKQHQPVGLVDTETGEILSPGQINRNLAVQAGIIEPPAPRTKKRDGGDPPPAANPQDPAPPPRRSGVTAPIMGNDPAMTGGVRVTAQRVDGLAPGQVGPLPAQVLALEVQWPSWALAFFDLLRGEFLDDNDQPYDWSSKSFVRFVLDTYRHACRQLLERVMDRRLTDVSAADRARAVEAALATIEGMDTGAMLQLIASRVEQEDPEWARVLRSAAR